jgi:hypothetical protein
MVAIAFEDNTELHVPATSVRLFALGVPGVAVASAVTSAVCTTTTLASTAGTTTSATTNGISVVLVGVAVAAILLWRRLHRRG